MEDEQIKSNHNEVQHENWLKQNEKINDDMRQTERADPKRGGGGKKKEREKLRIENEIYSSYDQ